MVIFTVSQPFEKCSLYGVCNSELIVSSSFFGHSLGRFQNLIFFLGLPSSLPIRSSDKSRTFPINQDFGIAFFAKATPTPCSILRSTLDLKAGKEIITLVAFVKVLGCIHDIGNRGCFTSLPEIGEIVFPTREKRVSDNQDSRWSYRLGSWILVIYFLLDCDGRKLPLLYTLHQRFSPSFKKLTRRRS